MRADRRTRPPISTIAEIAARTAIAFMPGMSRSHGAANKASYPTAVPAAWLLSEAIARRNIRGERGWIAERAHAVVGPEPQTGAMNVDPGFNSPGTTHYTLKSTSLARNAADPSSTISIERGRDSVAVVGDLV